MLTKEEMSPARLAQFEEFERRLGLVDEMREKYGYGSTAHVKARCLLRKNLTEPIKR